MRKLIFAALIVMILYFPASASIQTDLEAQFDIVETFDQLQDWSPTLSPGATGTFTSQLPVKEDSSPSIWDMWDFWYAGGTSGGAFISNNSGNTFNSSSKSLKLDVNDGPSPGRFGLYFGGSTADSVDGFSSSGVVESGYRSDVYIFWMTKHVQQNFDGYPWPYTDQSGCHKIGTISMGFTDATTATEGGDDYGAANSHYSIWGGASYGDHLHYVLQWFSNAEWSEVVAQDITAVRTLHAGTYLDQLYIEDSAWYGTEIHIHLGTPGVADGYQEVWTYDYLGNVTYGGKSNNFVFRQTGKNWGLNRAFWGGNQCLVDTDTATYYIDDIVINGSRIGPTYFSILASGSPTYDPPTISVQDTNTSTSTATIAGTYTIDSELSVGLCTWSHTGGSITGFATVLLGVVSGTVTGLPVGATTVSFSLLDSESQEATDTALFTRSEATTDVSKGVTIQGVQWNQ